MTIKFLGTHGTPETDTYFMFEVEGEVVEVAGFSWN